MSLFRKFSKLTKSVQSPLNRHGLRLGTAASFEHEPLLRSLGAIDTVLDVGANSGQFALLCHSCFPDAQIHSFEPLSGPADRFAALFEGRSRVTLHRCALGSVSGQSTIHVTQRDDSSSLLQPDLQSAMFKGTHAVRTDEIAIKRLSDVLTAKDLKGRCLMKIDVQGFEAEVLKGSEDLLQALDWIYCEASFVGLYKDQPLAHEIIAWLAERGFVMAGVETDPLMKRNGRSIQADFLFQKT